MSISEFDLANMQRRVARAAHPQAAAAADAAKQANGMYLFSTIG